MSGQRQGQEPYYQPPPGPPPNQQQGNQSQNNPFHSNNPYAHSQEAETAWSDQPPDHHPNPSSPSYPATGTGFGGLPHHEHFDNHNNQPPPGQAPQRSETFQETDFIPESERGEQREAMEQFELSKAGQQSQEDRDVEKLQRQFPGVDGSLIAALYGDTKNFGGTREMLEELGGGGQGQ